MRSGAMAFVQGPASFYTLRFLLGVAEAGFFPGIILYLSYWFVHARRAQMTLPDPAWLITTSARST